jgi:ABC-type polysaccharide/polyol phosphate export permease
MTLSGARDTRAGRWGADLALTLIERRIRLRTKRSTLWAFWPFLVPGSLMALYVLVFKGVFRVPIPDYPLFILSGLLPWVFLTQTLGDSLTSLVNDADLIRTARFRYELLPIAAVTVMFLYFLISMAMFIGLLAVIGRLNLAALPAVVFPILSLYLFVAGLSLLLSLIDVYNRDLRSILGNLLAAWFFLVPVLYKHEMAEGGLAVLLRIDPVAILVGQFRGALYYPVTRPSELLLGLAICGASFLACLGVFRVFSPRLPKDI